MELLPLRHGLFKPPQAEVAPVVQDNDGACLVLEVILQADGHAPN